jgi:two-component system LytT family sensor kinase
MNRDLYIRLIRTALISSPIIALYGVTPFYVFSKVPPKYILFAFFAIAVNVLIFWLINILTIRLSGTENKWKRYIFSYAFVAAFHLLLFILKEILPEPPFLYDGELSFRKDVFVVYPFVTMLAINTIIIIICNSILATQKHKTAEIEIQELKVSNLEAQKQVLLQQLQPHFLFNTLSVLKSLIKENPDEAENYSIKLSEFLRYSIQVHKSDLVTVEQELKFTNDYIDLQKVRFENSVIFDVNIPQAVYKMQLPAYALQALVENAIKHNTFTEKRPLRISISIDGDVIVVRNNKMPAKAADTTGTGLKNLNQRYQIIANKEIEITDTNDEFSAKVYLLNGQQI